MNESKFSPTSSRSLDVKALQQRLRTQVFGSAGRLLYFPAVDSTNTRAMQLALEGAEAGVVVLADDQTAGKGRLGRRWLDIPGNNVLLSVVLQPLFPPRYIVEFASLAVVDAIQETCQIAATIKWPNDVLINNRKVAGILIETSHTSSGRLVAILGIGVNVNVNIQHWSAELQDQAALIANATTLETEHGQPVEREIFIAHLLAHLEASYLALQQEMSDASPGSDTAFSRSLLERWRSQLSTPGRAVAVHQGDTVIHGIAEDVNDDGELLLRLASGEQVTITWGDVGNATE